MAKPKFDELTRAECIQYTKIVRGYVSICIKNRGLNPADWMAAELEYRNDLIAIRERLLSIEVAERDALSIEVQKQQLELEEARAAAHET